MTPRFSQTFAPLPTTIFTVMSALATEHGAINLGQGFPDEDGPIAIRRAAAQALLESSNQYPPMRGLPALREAVAAANRRFYGIGADPATEILVTSGATEALSDCFLGLLNSGDDVIVFEPVYDSYAPMIALTGATVVPIRLAPPDFALPRAVLEAAFGPRTKLIVVNSPMNPCGKVFSDDDLAFIAELCVRYDVLALCDEVYEHLIFDGKRHRPLMTFPGMEARTARVGSAGKTFSLTGWKVGYVTARAVLLDPIAKAHQFVTFTTAPALQIAIAQGLAAPGSYFEGLAQGLAKKRDRLARGLAALGFEALPCAGTYFLTVGFSGFGLEGTAEEICRRLTIEAKVAAIPLDAFYTDGVGRPYLRFCFCKSDAVLDEALARLSAYFERRRFSSD